MEGGEELLDPGAQVRRLTDAADVRGDLLGRRALFLADLLRGLGRSLHLGVGVVHLLHRARTRSLNTASRVLLPSSAKHFAAVCVPKQPAEDAGVNYISRIIELFFRRSAEVVYS